MMKRKLGAHSMTVWRGAIVVETNEQMARVDQSMITQIDWGSLRVLSQGPSFD